MEPGTNAGMTKKLKLIVRETEDLEDDVPDKRHDFPKDAADAGGANFSSNVNSVEQVDPVQRGDGFGEVNMEATVTVSDVMKAGGLGTTDDISCPIPVSSDYTDFECYLNGIRDSEEFSYNITGQPSPYKTIPEEHETTPPKDAIESVYVEAPATADEVIRAGGFGATDDISSVLPVASDFTDFEAHLRNAQCYEDLEREISRPGLGWNADSK